MKILMIVHGFAPECSGGTESYVLRLCRDLMKRGHHVEVFCGSHEGAGPGEVLPRQESFHHEGIPVHRIHRTGLYVDNWEKGLAPEIEPFLAAVLDEMRPDLVHVHHWIRLSRNLIEISHARGIPALCTLHDLSATCPKNFRLRKDSFCDLPMGPESCLGCAPEGEFLERHEIAAELELYREDFANELALARRIVVPSVAHRDLIRGHEPALEGRLRVVPHGNISTLRYRRPQEVSFPEGPLVIGHWGHLSVLKGIDVLLEALRESVHRDRVRLELFGEIVYPDERPLVEKLTADLDVTWHGRYAPEDLARVPMDLAVIPTRCSESHSFVLDEAFLLGLPALVPERGALPERLFGAGATFEPESAAALRAVIDALFDDPDRLESWRRRVPRLTAMRDHVEGLERVYHEIVSSKAPLGQTPLALRARRIVQRTRQLENRTRMLARERHALGNVRGDYSRAQATMAKMQHFHEEKDRELDRLKNEVRAHRDGAAALQTALEAAQDQARSAELRAATARRAELAAERGNSAIVAGRLRSILDSEVAPEDGALPDELEPLLDRTRAHLSERDGLVQSMAQSLDDLLETLERVERRRRPPDPGTRRSSSRRIDEPLKVLFVIHQFLPRHVAGTEVYTRNLARELMRRGVRVAILTAESDHSRPRFETSRREWDGIPIHQVIHNYTWEHFQETYDCPEADSIFRRVLREEQPDVVHVQHLHYFSANFVTIARSRGIPVIYTLHDYMLLCPRDGLMMRADGEICERPIPTKCADCIAHLPLAATPAPPVPRALRPGADSLIPEIVAREILRTRTAADLAHPHAVAIAERLDYLKRILRDVDLFISPSHFLRDRFREAGLVDSDQIVVSDNGYEITRSAAAPAPREGLRVGYVGTIAEHKGLHVLIEAMEGIDDPRVSCRIWGNLDAFIEYSDRLRGLISNPRTLLMGPVPPESVPRVLATTDVLVIPSLWYENSPLTVHEAALAGIPVIASDLGGLAEYVQEGVTGLRFRTGDVADLRAKILSFLEEPGPLPDFRPAALPIKTIADDAAEMQRRYEHLLSARAGIA